MIPHAFSCCWNYGEETMFDIRNGVVLALYFAIVYGKAQDVVQQNSLQVLQNIPALFEHVMNMLQERPHALEKDDITTFLETRAAMDNVYQLTPEENYKIVKREVEDYDEDFTIDAEGREYNWYILKADKKEGEYEFGGFLGSIGLGDFRLTPDEVAERTMEVEKDLESYNNDTN